MEDPVEVRLRIDRVLKRVERRDDYGTLLARGDVVRGLQDVGDPDAWRAGLRRRARADRLRIRSGTGRSAVWALLLDGDTEHREPKASATATFCATWCRWPCSTGMSRRSSSATATR